jgi:sensor c-di-GMP phosphodiesterase-like protein
MSGGGDSSQTERVKGYLGQAAPLDTMSNARKRRILLGRLTIIAMAACGMAVGYMLGCGLALIRANNWLENYADTTATRDNAALAEASNVLHAMQALRYGFCSNTEIANFRTVVFHSEYVKDAGRILGSKIGCSATSGRSSLISGWRTAPSLTAISHQLRMPA